MDNVQTPGGNTTTAGAVEMARRICAEHCGADEIGKMVATGLIAGQYDDDPEMKIALAAIIETQELIAAWLEQYPSPMDDLGMAMRIREICASIRSGQQFRKDV